MGMPELIINFKKLGESAKSRSLKGVVALIINDTTVSGTHIYSRVSQITEAYSASNLALLKMCFNEYGVNKLIVVSKVTEDDLANALNLIKTTKLDFLALPYAVTGDNAKAISFIEAQRLNNIMSKVVLVNEDADLEYVINFTSDGIEESGVDVTPELFTVDLACAFATTPLTQSATYYVFNKVTKVNEKTNKDTATDNGEVFLINDGDKIKLSRAVTSLKTLTGEKKAALKKIKIVEGADLIKSDIYSVFQDQYVGKVDNNYDNKALLVSDINTYLESMTTQGVLNPDGTNLVKLDLDSQRDYIEKELGIDTTNMKDIDVLRYPTDSFVFLTGQVTFADSVEDITLNLYY